jgi:enoyl-CoA hydratase/carnithine racemase
MAYETIAVEKQDGIAVITLNRPQRLNAWTPAMGTELGAGFREVDRDPAVRVVLFTGAEGPAGVPGPARFEEFPALMRRLSKPVIAAINGFALGKGKADAGV